jgi:hypothetical protein
MIKRDARGLVFAAALLAAFGLVGLAGCSKDLMSPDEQGPVGSAITNPTDGSSLNETVINVRGRAETGAKIDIFVDDEYRGTGTAGVVQTQGGSNFTVEDVDLGEEGMKHIVAKITDLYGNVASDAETPRVTIALDLTAPPAVVDTVANAALKDTVAPWGDFYWTSGQPQIMVQGTTDASAAGARIMYGAEEYDAPSLDAVSGDPDARQFTITLPIPKLTTGETEITILYRLEVYDAASNVTFDIVPVHWRILAQEVELKHDDGHYDYFQHTVTSNYANQMIAVRFQAPTWANYVTKIKFYSANDQQDNEIHPDQSSARPVILWVWRCSADSLPGAKANNGMPLGGAGPYGGYPEDAWVTTELSNAVNITNNDLFPDRKFFVGLEWLWRGSPAIYEDHASATNVINYASYFWNFSEWVLRRDADTMIRAFVSDVPGGNGRVAEITPTIVRVPERR